MNLYTVTSNNGKLKFNLNRTERILQNVRNILSIYKGEVIMNRELGIDPKIIDSPLNESERLIDIKEALEEQEEKIVVNDVKYIVTNNKLEIEVEVGILE